MKKFSIVTGIALTLASLAGFAADDVASRTDDWFAQQRQLTDGNTAPRAVSLPANGASETCPYDRSADKAFRDFWAQLQLTDGIKIEMTQSPPQRYAGRSAAGAEKLAMMDCGEMMNQAR